MKNLCVFVLALTLYFGMTLNICEARAHNDNLLEPAKEENTQVSENDNNAPKTTNNENSETQKVQAQEPKQDEGRPEVRDELDAPQYYSSRRAKRYAQEHQPPQRPEAQREAMQNAQNGQQRPEEESKVNKTFTAQYNTSTPKPSKSAYMTTSTYEKSKLEEAGIQSPSSIQQPKGTARSHSSRREARANSSSSSRRSSGTKDAR